LIGAGISAIKIQLDIELEGSGDKAEGEEIGVPIPVISSRLTWRVQPRAHLNLDLSAIKGSIGDVEGRFIDAAVTLDYFVTKNFGFGFGYNIVDAEYIEDKPLRRLQTNMTYDGLRLYGTFAF